MTNFRDEKFILIYQMGKVGSRTIAKSIEKKGFTVMAPHSMMKRFLEELFPYYKNPKTLGFSEKIRIIKAKIKRKFIIKILKSRKKLKVITIVREPISRNISMFFQDIYIPLLNIAKNTDIRVAENVNLSRLINEFHYNFNHFYGIEWFDNEIKKYFGIDIYQYNFNKELGYEIIKKGNVEVLIIKFEKFDGILSDAICKFLGINELEIINENISEKKWYDCVYKEFKKNIKFQKEFLDKIYNSKYMQHFYTNKEILDYFEKYVNNDNSVY